MPRGTGINVFRPCNPTWYCLQGFLSFCPDLGNLPLCRGSEAYDASRSASNPAEAQAVKQLVRQLVEAGVPRSDIGVICFFRAQV